MLEERFVGITMGDPAGIGPEISLKAIDKKNEYKQSVLIYGSYGVLKYYHDLLSLQTPLVRIDRVQEFQKGKINVISVVDLEIGKDIILGQVSSVAGDAAYQYIARAIADAMKGDISVVTTAPLNKEALHEGGHHFDGHTEIFATLTHTQTYTMMLWSDRMSVVHVSTHCALREACNRATKKRVLECIHLADDVMRRLEKKIPKIAVAGLNPHSGEAGLFGQEEIEEIAPAVEQAIAEGLQVTGPVPPDTVFLKAYKGVYDIVVAMYHDQGHIPMKMIAFDSGVNVTLGLPIIRTSVDHGTAFDIAGKGIANEESMLYAVDLGKRFAES
ncbi:4-hydroxythreonine-4-phosphate dehydrogenase PdxA [Megasphaera cerevisiae]|jgi:4-hydroxythreonine-4-phosphate dehydrogenase|uniref:4-hydroxythreonine-4-phosphate dehydrogenase PdxA n=1 Tax=Megasphaera cerevisiae TaxID=39029 RepID=UPI0009C596E2|nr:4-hydroxythreonine-4-phosphate dehydrogenase PdxA [Megasphaera cerevisiae]SJZ53756.1 4-hydroxythreonine-4-phosphate dehydrogenase [Megasphaera cerevisiae DSM 20462]